MIMIIFLKIKFGVNKYVMLNYYKELVFYVQRLIGDKDNAKDVVQEAYSRMITVNKNADIENQRAYLYKISRNIVIDKQRRDKSNLEINYEEEDYSIPVEDQPEVQVCKENQHEILMKIVLTLPLKNQQAFILHVIDGFSRKEISQKMGISIGAVEKHIIRATEKIKIALEKVERS